MDLEGYCNRVRFRCLSWEGFAFAFSERSSKELIARSPAATRCEGRALGAMEAYIQGNSSANMRLIYSTQTGISGHLWQFCISFGMAKHQSLHHSH